MIAKIEEDNYYFSNEMNLLYLKNFEKTINNEKHGDIRKKNYFNVEKYLIKSFNVDFQTFL